MNSLGWKCMKFAYNKYFNKKTVITQTFDSVK